jgi:hypothetical protein
MMTSRHIPPPSGPIDPPSPPAIDPASATQAPSTPPALSQNVQSLTASSSSGDGSVSPFLPPLIALLVVLLCLLFFGARHDWFRLRVRPAEKSPVSTPTPAAEEPIHVEAKVIDHAHLRPSQPRRELPASQQPVYPWGPSRSREHRKWKESDGRLPAAGVLPRPSFWPEVSQVRSQPVEGGTDMWPDLVLDDPTAGDSEQGSPRDPAVEAETKLPSTILSSTTPERPSLEV